MAVSGTHDGGAQQVLVFVYHHQYVYQEGKEQHVPFRILARCKQIDTRIGAKRPVVVLAGAVHAVVGFFVKQYGEVMLACDAAMANQLNEFKVSIDKLMEEGVGKDEAIFRIMKETIIASEPIRFEGDGYSEQWKQEAARRGLTNICHVPEALMHYMDNQSRSVLIGERIFNETELACRLEVELEKYTMKVQIESRVLGDLAINHIVPTAVIYQNRLLENLRGLRETFSPEEYEVLSADRKELVREISKRVTAIKVQVREMTEARKVANHMDNYKDKAFAYEETVRPYLESIRDHIDHLEMEIDDEIWPLPKYRELLFTK